MRGNRSTGWHSISTTMNGSPSVAANSPSGERPAQRDSVWTPAGDSGVTKAELPDPVWPGRVGQTAAAQQSTQARPQFEAAESRCRNLVHGAQVFRSQNVSGRVSGHFRTGGAVGSDSASHRQPMESAMPRYLIERDFPDGLSIPMNADGRKAIAGVVTNNAEHGVTWVHSYVSPDRKQTFCIYDAPAPEAIRQVADRNGLPVGRITEVTVLDPYFYQADPVPALR